jgi:hypothetical protein
VGPTGGGGPIDIRLIYDVKLRTRANQPASRRCHGRAFYSGSFIDSPSPSLKIVEEDEIVIKKVKQGYKVLSEKGKNMGGPYKTKAEAEKRLRQVEFFKRRKG